ncbi:hypothetical protein BGX38DRAFT_1187814 [Terfezia claveryi]|nr:hypothetical protein BGX38DRAFT_1187814 [Terfezia claveryi]
MISCNFSLPHSSEPSPAKHSQSDITVSSAPPRTAHHSPQLVKADHTAQQIDQHKVLVD